MYNDPNQPQSPPYGPPQQQPPRYVGPYGPSPQQPTQPAAPYGPPATPFDQAQYAPTQYIPPQIAPTLPPTPPGSPGSSSAPSRRRSSRRGLWITIGAVLAGIVIAFFAFFVLRIIFNGSTARSAIDEYYQDVMQQQYDSAYSYFDTSHLTARETAAGQTIFVRAQQIVDLTYGRVTSYTITNVNQLDDQTATIIVNFTRRGKVYQTQYTLKKINGAWKIEQAQQ